VAIEFLCRSSVAYLSQWLGVVPLMALKNAMNALSLANPSAQPQ
jgi:hypothetical protein